MTDVFVKGIIFFLAIVGFIEVIKIFVLLFTNAKTGHYSAIVVPIYGHDEDVEILLRSFISMIKWDEGCKIHQLVCLNCNMDEETLSICHRVCKEYDFVEVCTPEEYFKTINGNCT